MKVVFVLEFDVDEDDTEALCQQVSAGVVGMRGIQQGWEPVTSARREVYIAIRESADAVLKNVEAVV